MRLRVMFGLVLVSPLCAQVLLNRPGEPASLISSDAAILDGQENRTDFSCRAKPVRPELGFDLALHSGYEVTVPLAELAGDGNRLVAIFRVTPEGHPDRSVYLSQKWTVPSIPGNARGAATLEGSFALGEGKYQVQWLLRDKDERYCSAKWQIAAEARVKERPIVLRLTPETIAPEPTEKFYNEPAVPRDERQNLKVLVLLHITDQHYGTPGFHGGETDSVLSILRSIAREPRISQYTMTAFNLERGEILFRSENAEEVDFKRLGEAIKPDRLTTINVHVLGQKDVDVQFLRSLLASETEKDRPDALIFVGSKATPFFGIRSVFKQAAPHYPVFYLNYDPNPAANPWRDLIGSVVKLWDGLEYRINKPRDLFVAWNDIMSRISTKEPAAGDVTPSLSIEPLLPKNRSRP